MKFNRGEVQFGNKIEKPSQDDIKNTQGLWNASFDDAFRFGGDVTRAALQAMNVRGDKKHIVVDVKTHMLMPGMIPAIPGWHTDGVPRGGKSLSPASGAPHIHMQEGTESPRYHLLVVGGDCPTKFIASRNINLVTENLPNLYAGISSQVCEMDDKGFLDTYDAPDGQVVEWDWWELHTAQQARAPGWRYLIRVTETDYLEPQKDLRLVLRNQQQVYLPTEKFGW
ncbi:hypothetical protein CR3_gp049 [Cronobacter phage CR3]|uniref:Uncharacterized protein n=2 Tax=Certrevirus TaxID=1914850 RepID=I1TR91_9CAUD|nr:hypothetical protein CR3_gp049 [Cronobacter phage CR3]YP_009189020.1 hypothetical protein ADU18_0159 [Cronobacter phage PBES 02]AFH21214.1 hypothetical protein CR3_049 [Cronobacter phage CR3]AKY04059.1 hypothetical protein ADU18_0159 [Cronobacter phage PBES 02]